MGFISKSKSSGSENWGMGLLLVFFSEDDTIINRETTPFSSSPSSSTTNNANIRRTNSNNLILAKTQSTISICALLVFITLLLFTLSTFEPSIPRNPHHLITITSRRHLSEKPPFSKPKKTSHNSPFFSSWVGKLRPYKSTQMTKDDAKSSYALQGLGTLFMRGTRAMNDLTVVHLMDDNIRNEDQFRLFLRLLHRSGLTSKSDTVFIFPSQSGNYSIYQRIVREENDSFLKLVCHYKKELTNNSATATASFDLTQYLKIGKKAKEKAEPIWGKKVRSNYNNSEGETESSELSYGSVVGFDTADLDPENSLVGFLDHVPMSLRRWACYPMLLGRVRRNYKHIMLVDMKNLLILGDPLGRVRNMSSESVYLLTTPPSSNKHARKNSDKTRSVNSAIIMGGTRGVRRLSNAMLTEIVRAAMQQHKGKHPVTESGILSQLVRNEFILKDSVNLITSTESIPESSSLTGLGTNSDSSLFLSGYSLLQRGNSNFETTIMKHICSFEVDSSVYRDCEQQKNRDMNL